MKTYHAVVNQQTFTVNAKSMARAIALVEEIWRSRFYNTEMLSLKIEVEC